MELASELVVAEAALAIVIDDRGVEYPLTVDPLMTSPAWTAESDQAFANFGFSVATAGDVNGDGFSDVIVGAFFFDNGQADEGRAFVYHGSASGLSGAANWTAESNQIDAWFGYSVATAGDVNGDGFSDVIVGGIFLDNGQTDEGRAFVYLGSASGLSAAPNWTAESDQESAFFGISVATAGDVNGDGFGDVIVGSYLFDNGQADEGRAFVYHGSVGGLSLAANWTAEGDQATAVFGISVATAGDVNGDGFSDVIVGASNYDNGQTDEGRTLVYHGSAGGLSLAANWTAEGNQASAFFGQSMAGAGDVNGDGYSDVIVGAHSYDNGQTNEGRAFVYQGSGVGLGLTPAWTAESNQTGADFGISVATAGDVNGDGFADVIVGATVFDNGQTDEGRAFVYHGSAAGLGTIPAWTAEPNLSNARFGSSVATAGDVNGDGFSDVIVGAPSFNGGQSEEGRAFTYHGSAAGLSTTAAWTVEGDQGDSFFGFSVATAGDVNGDGYGDVIVGAAGYDNGETNEGRAYVYLGAPGGLPTVPVWTAESNQPQASFGISAGTAGDVNGDGYSDIIVGAHLYDNGETDEGRAFVYLGSAAGLAISPAWTAESDQTDASLGLPVATAGDVNGDGYSDVIVSANSYDNGEIDEGRAFVYLGSAAGLAPSPAWTAEGDQALALFGTAVASAGDVNGDGFSDVIVGAFWYDNGQTDEGRAFVYEGSAAGLATIPAWTTESNQTGASLGVSAATAGDVNGDGFSDVIVGALFYDNGQTNEGRAFLYQGSAGGLGGPVWTAEGDQASVQFGNPVATAGDVNGDGFSDVIIGAYVYNSGDGRAFVYLGSPGGLFTLPDWQMGSNQGGARFGFGAGTAGDVNGDGYSEVIVGAYQFDNGEPNEGRAFVFYGNGGAGLDRIARQVRTDDAAPIALLGRSDSESAFRLKALGRTPAGRGGVRLQFEVKPFGIPFDGNGLVMGPESDTGAPAGFGSAVPLTELANGLIPQTLYHWRLRVITDSPFFPRSPWLWLPGNASTEADLRTEEPTTAVSEGSASPTPGILLEAPTPNPFAEAIRFSYTLSRGGRHHLAVYDVQGREVTVLAEGIGHAGRHTLHWDGRDTQGRRVPAGVYFLRLAFSGRVEAQKLVLAP
jgi:hypothetical protein